MIPMNIGFIGAGHVAGALAVRWAASGHRIRFGVKDPSKPRRTTEGIAGDVATTTVREAVRDADVVVLTTPWSAARSALQSAGDLSGKVLFDATNPLRPDLSGVTTGGGPSAGEQVARWAANARVVKVFNTTGFNIMADPAFHEGRATMFYAGDDPAAKRVAHDLAEQIGFEPMDAGPIANAGMLESLAALWVYTAIHGGESRGQAFRLMRR
jgi:8-hydroxy-5-deazaflavin:NADPH oxidoreductase